MSLKLFAHPFSSYCQKVLMALYEHGTIFEFCMLSPDHPQVGAEFAALWPMRKMPLLLDGERVVPESSIIIEYLELHHPGRTRLLPQDPRAALEVRLMDRYFDSYVMTPMQRIVGDRLRPEERRDAQGVSDARALLDMAYRWLEQTLQQRSWAAGDSFSLADCAAAPALFYADWAHPIDPSCTTLRAYRQRLLERPSFARAVDEARPYRQLFPLGAPDRD